MFPFVLQVCNVVCCGPSNFEQHNRSKKHIRKEAQLKSCFGEFGEGEEAGRAGSAIDSLDEQGDSVANTTYVGINSSCRPYCTQVSSLAFKRMNVLVNAL